MTWKALVPIAVLSASFATHAQQAEPSTLDAIVVTAQKRPQPAQDAPISMVVIGQDGLELSGSGNLEDIQHLIPSPLKSRSDRSVLGRKPLFGTSR